ncbi:MAG: glycosyltransferase family 4 protein [Candidatus Peregrinibacteria bacterium]|nr:glycosyltransferase family 4 protein [Candidatus Peregrinibacteria bacterium]MCB9808042.1 glycosyltransferase family 4 protein [Candidatus Peribacteria bacterium]
MKTILLISPYWKEDHRWMVSTVKLAELWQRIGYKVVVVCMGEVENGKRKEERVSDTLTVHRVQDVFLKDPWNYGIAFGFTGYVRRLIREIQPDYIVCNKILFWTSFSVIALRLTGHKVILLTDAFVGMNWWPRSFLPKVAAAIYAWTAGWLIMLCSHTFVTFFPQPPSLLKKLLIYKKTQVIPTGIDSEKMKVERGKRKEVTVSYVGRLESIKGVDDFLAALTPLKAEYPDIKLQVVGFYKEGHPLVEQYQRDVSFTGLRDDIPEILSKTDIFVMPSYSEGLSNAIMEAMSSGCACVVSEVGGNVYLVKNGVSGFTYPAGDREALAAHVRRLLDDPAKRKALGAAARKRIEEEFSWDIVGKKYKTLFESV